MTTFQPFQKIPRLSRGCVITEKLDGTNASIFIGESGEFLVGSRTRWITPLADNYGFAQWAYENREELMQLGVGHHFGEWWGAGVQRRYNVAEKRFSLFNVARWAANSACVLEGQERCPECCYVVPVLFRGDFTTDNVQMVLTQLYEGGSRAAPGFMDPEGIIIYHEASGTLFKKTIKGDEAGKSAEAHPPRPKELRLPKDPSKGGRRVAQLYYEGDDRRKPRA